MNAISQDTAALIDLVRSPDRPAVITLRVRQFLPVDSTAIVVATPEGAEFGKQPGSPEPQWWLDYRDIHDFAWRIPATDVLAWAVGDHETL